jgi:hypothetical protein
MCVFLGQIFCGDQHEFLVFLYFYFPIRRERERKTTNIWSTNFFNWISFTKLENRINFSKTEGILARRRAESRYVYILLQYESGEASSIFFPQPSVQQKRYPVAEFIVPDWGGYSRLQHRVVVPACQPLQYKAWSAGVNFIHPVRDYEFGHRIETLRKSETVGGMRSVE